MPALVATVIVGDVSNIVFFVATNMAGIYSKVPLKMSKYPVVSHLKILKSSLELQTLAWEPF